MVKGHKIMSLRVIADSKAKKKSYNTLMSKFYMQKQISNIQFDALNQRTFSLAFKVNCEQ